MALLPEKYVKQYKGIFIGLCTGAIAAIIFAELVPECVECVYQKGVNTVWGEGHSHGGEHEHQHGGGHGHQHGGEHGHQHGGEHGHQHGENHDHQYDEGHGHQHGGEHEHQHDEGHGHQHGGEHEHQHGEDHDHQHGGGHGHQHGEGHGLEEHGEGHDHQDDEGHGDSLHFHARLLGGLVLAGLLSNFLIEMAVHAMMPGEHTHFGEECSHHHGHSHGSSAPSEAHSHGTEHGHHGHSHGLSASSDAHSHGVEMTETCTHDHSHAHKDHSAIHCHDEKPHEGHHSKSWFSQFFQIPKPVWIFVCAMTLHHIGDGLLVGLNKDTATKCGMISLGIAAHEFPHCLGAIAFFVTKGCQKSHGIFLLILSGLGYFIGVGVIHAFKGYETEVELYGTFFVLGVFMYVLFFILMPEFINAEGCKSVAQRGVSFTLTLLAVSALIYCLHEHD